MCDCETDIILSVTVKNEQGVNYVNHQVITPEVGSYYSISLDADKPECYYFSAKVQQGYNISLPYCTNSFKYILYKNNTPVEWGWIKGEKEFYTNYYH